MAPGRPGANRVDGTKRTAGWVKGGVGGTLGKARSGAAGLGGGASKRTSTATGAARDGIGGAWDRVGGASLMQRARADSRIGAGLILGAILVLTWIAWTVYVWTENGSTAGLGVLISWPAVLVALALVAAPFVAAAMLARRLAENREPALAGGVPAAVESGAGKAEAPEQAEADDEGRGRGDDDGDEDEADDRDEDEAA